MDPSVRPNPARVRLLARKISAGGLPDHLIQQYAEELRLLNARLRAAHGLHADPARETVPLLVEAPDRLTAAEVDSRVEYARLLVDPTRRGWLMRMSPGPEALFGQAFRTKDDADRVLHASRAKASAFWSQWPGSAMAAQVVYLPPLFAVSTVDYVMDVSVDRTHWEIHPPGRSVVNLLLLFYETGPVVPVLRSRSLLHDPAVLALYEMTGPIGPKLLVRRLKSH